MESTVRSNRPFQMEEYLRSVICRIEWPEDPPPSMSDVINAAVLNFLRIVAPYDGDMAAFDRDNGAGSTRTRRLAAWAAAQAHHASADKTHGD